MTSLEAPKNRKILIAAGDSWTDDNYYSIYHADMDCSFPKWPELLAEKLDMDYMNLGKMGSGNEYIFANLLDKLQEINTDDIGLVLVGWTQAHRKDYKVGKVWQHNTRCRERLNNNIYGDDLWRVKESIVIYYSLQEICKSNNIPFKQFQMIPMFEDLMFTNPAHLDNHVWLKYIDSLLHTIYDSPFFDKLNESFIGWPTEHAIGGYNFDKGVVDYINNPTLQISELDYHPNALGQKKIADHLYENIYNMREK
jgi:hypothetical protein